MVPRSATRLGEKRGSRLAGGPLPWACHAADDMQRFLRHERKRAQNQFPFAITPARAIVRNHYGIERDQGKECHRVGWGREEGEPAQQDTADNIVSQNKWPNSAVECRGVVCGDGGAAAG